MSAVHWNKRGALLCIQYHMAKLYSSQKINNARLVRFSGLNFRVLPGFHNSKMYRLALVADC